MCFSDSKNVNAIYIMCLVLLIIAVIMLPFDKIAFSALICCTVILIIVLTITVTDSRPSPSTPLAPLAPLARRQPAARCEFRQPVPPRVADVPDNIVVAEPRQQLALPLQMEVSQRTDPRDDVAQCGGGFTIIPPNGLTLPNLPPFPGVAQYTGDSVWRLPEWPADQPSREGTIAAVVSDLPTCCNDNPRDVIRNQGLYGIKGNTACDLLKRSAVADSGFLQPLGARNAFLAYNSYDQLHAKDPFMIPIQKQVF